MVMNSLLSFLSCTSFLTKIEKSLCDTKCDSCPVGPTGQTATPSGPTGPEFLLLRRDAFQGLNPQDKEQTYFSPPGATHLFVQLWGAGGGGGGAATQKNVKEMSVGGGGGAGGYVQAWIENPVSSYSFHLRRGGKGGQGDDPGEDALPSYFDSMESLYANGGTGGKSGRQENDLGFPLIVDGGQGGNSGGSLAIVMSTGGSGTQGVASQSIAERIYVQAGTGGSNFAGSGATVSPSLFNLSAGDSANGNKGKQYGEGGNGAIALNMITVPNPAKSADGGNGNAASLIIEAYQVS